MTDEKEKINKETLFADAYFGKGTAKYINDLLLNPDGEWNNVIYRSAILTKLFPACVKIKEFGYEAGKSEVIKDKKLVPIEEVMEIIEIWLKKYVPGLAGEELKSKLGELAK